MAAALREWSRRVAVVFLGALLGGGREMGPPAPAQSPPTLQDNLPGRLHHFPIFDILMRKEAQIHAPCNGVSGRRLRLTFMGQASGASNGSVFCPSFDERYPWTPHQTLVFDLDTEIGGNCPTGQGYVVIFAESQCLPTAPATTCPTATGG